MREAHAMARLSHPNVVAIYDVDTEGDSVILAMELVRGETLARWLARDRSRSWSQIVAAFVGAGRGLAAAHAASLLHRDFKPANVLMGDDGRARVTDFGLARSHGSSNASVNHTSGSETAPQDGGSDLDETGADAWLGTPEYMAPEQHEGGVVGPAADQYAFCVSLWEGLTGTRPFQAPDEEILAWTKQRGTLPWPKRVLVPKAIVSAITRGLAVDPGDRWPSMDALLAALASVPGRQRRQIVFGTSLATAMAFLGVAWAGWQQQAARCTGAPSLIAEAWDAPRRERMREAMFATNVIYAADAWAYAGSRLDAYAADWASMHRQVCEATTVHHVQSAEVMDLQMACLHRAKVQLAAVADVLSGADAGVIERAHDVVGRLPPLEGCEDVEALRSDVPPPRSSDRKAVEALRVELAQANALHHAGKLREAGERIEAVAERAREIDYAPLHTEVLHARGLSAVSSAAWDEAELALEQALRSALRSRQIDEARVVATLLTETMARVRFRPREALAYAETARALVRPSDDLSMAAVRAAMSAALSEQGRLALAQSELRAAIALSEKAHGGAHPDIANLKYELSNLLTRQARYQEAVDEARASAEIIEQTLGKEHPGVALARGVLGNALTDLGRYEEAVVEQQATLELWSRLLGPDHPFVATARVNLATVYREQGRIPEAIAETRAALASLADRPDYTTTAVARVNLGAYLRDQGDFAAAEVEIRLGLQATERIYGAENPIMIRIHNNLGNILHDAGKYEEAEQVFRGAEVLGSKVLGSEHPVVLLARIYRADVLRRTGRYSEAEAELRAIDEVGRRVLPANAPELTEAHCVLGQVLVQTERNGEARKLLEETWATAHDNTAVPLKIRAAIAFTLAQLLWRDRQEQPRAVELARTARAHYASTGYQSSALNEVETWLRSRSGGLESL